MARDNKGVMDLPHTLTFHVIWAMVDHEEDKAWGWIQEMTTAELDDLEDTLDRVQDLVDARHAAEALRKAAHEPG